MLRNPCIRVMDIEFPLHIGDTVVYGCRLPEPDARGTRRRDEIDAVAAIVREVFGAEARLMHDPDGAPYISGSDVSISVSHGGGYALLAVNRLCKIGVDIERARPTLMRVATRFMSESELVVYGRSVDTALVAWTAKEAVFKAMGDSALTVSAIHIPAFCDGGIIEVSGVAFRMHVRSYGQICITLAERL